jgi:hypothetical protein
LFAFDAVPVCPDGTVPRIQITFGNRPDLDGQVGTLTFSTGGSVPLTFDANGSTTIAYPASAGTGPVTMTYTLGQESVSRTTTFPEACSAATTTTTTRPIPPTTQFQGETTTTVPGATTTTVPGQTTTTVAGQTTTTAVAVIPASASSPNTTIAVRAANLPTTGSRPLGLLAAATAALIGGGLLLRASRQERDAS